MSQLCSGIFVSVFVLYLATICALLSTGPPRGCWDICDTAAEPPQKVQTEKQISGEKWTGSERDWRPSWNCDTVSSKPAPLLPYQPARLALLIEPAASKSLAEIDCVAVSITSSTTISPPPHPSSHPCCLTLWLRPLLVIYLLRAFLIWAWVAHHCSHSLPVWMEASFTGGGFMDFWHGAWASKPQGEDKNCFMLPCPPWITSKSTTSS